MKKLIILLLIAGIGFSACKKDDTPLKTLLVNVDINKYNPVQINDQIWTTVNYDGMEGYDPVKSSWVNINNERTYGFEDIATIKAKLTDGWRIPTKDDLTKLAKNLGGTGGWKNDGGIAEIMENPKGATFLLDKTWPATFTGGGAGFNALPVIKHEYIGANDKQLYYANMTLYLCDSNGDANNLTFMQFLSSSYYNVYIYFHNNTNLNNIFDGNSGTLASLNKSFSIRFVKDK